MPKPEIYKLSIDGSWTLNDLHEFPYAYTQAYSFLYSLMISESEGNEWLDTTYTIYPWTGGYSAVNFYNYLYKLVPPDERPLLISFSYSSPGWIEISLVLAVAMSLKRVIYTLCDSVSKINDTYTNIHKGLHERKLLKLESKSAELNLDREHLKFVEESAEIFAKLIGFSKLDDLYRLAPNRLAALKIILSFYRRVRKLKEYQDNDKLKF